MITVEIAHNLVFERGLDIPLQAEYQSPELASIAVRMHEARQALTSCHIELQEMYEKASKDWEKGAHTPEKADSAAGLPRHIADGFFEPDYEYNGD